MVGLVSRIVLYLSVLLHQTQGNIRLCDVWPAAPLHHFELFLCGFPLHFLFMLEFFESSSAHLDVKFLQSGLSLGELRLLLGFFPSLLLDCALEILN